MSEAIKKTVEQIDDELCGAKEYLRCAEKYKLSGRQDWADKYFTMSQQEYQHAMLLHDIAVSQIEAEKKANTEKSADLLEVMQHVWDADHEEYMDKVSEYLKRVEAYKTLKAPAK